MGFHRWPLSLLAVVIAVLIVRKAIALFGRPDPADPDLAAGVDAIVFWGGVAAVLGVLGQLTGIYKALQVIIRASEISPRVIAMGFAQSFTTTIAGLVILLGSAVAWIILRGRLGSVIRRSRREIAGRG
jgi:biopolymer transport protein ExbB/TolQ